eukprot:1157770-Pelagomonas_calceolata.AAC.13
MEKVLSGEVCWSVFMKMQVLGSVMMELGIKDKRLGMRDYGGTQQAHGGPCSRKGAVAVYEY